MVEDELDDVDTDEVEQAIWNCDDWYCGSNSPEVDAFPAHDFLTDGNPNHNDFKMVSRTGAPGGYLYKCWNASSPAPCTTPSWYNFIVSESAGGTLLGVNPNTPFFPLGGVNLKWAYFYVQNGPQRYRVSIMAPPGQVAYEHFPAKLAPTYVFKWVKLDVNNNNSEPLFPRYANLCKNPPTDDPFMFGTNAITATVFPYDLIESSTFTITANQHALRWGIACAGHTLAHLQLTGHLTASSKFLLGAPRPVREMQTALNAFANIICKSQPSPRAYTVAGEGLYWRYFNNGVATPSQGTVSSMEILWNENGAVCMNQHRLVNPTDLNAANAAFPDDPTTPALGIVDAMHADGCAIPPPCADPNNLNNFGGTTFRTDNDN